MFESNRDEVYHIFAQALDRPDEERLIVSQPAATAGRYSPDGKWLATGGWDRTIKLRDAASGEERLTIFGHEGFVLDLTFSPDSRSLVSTSEDRSVRLWEVPTGRPIGVPW